MAAYGQIKIWEIKEMLSEKEKLELEQLKADENVKRALRQQRKKVDPERKKLYQYRWLKRRGEKLALQE